MALDDPAQGTLTNVAPAPAFGGEALRAAQQGQLQQQLAPLQVQEAQLQLQQQQYAIQRQKAMRTGLEALGANPSHAGYVKFALQFPDVGKQMTDAVAALGEEEKTARVQQMVPALNALRAGRPDTALRYLEPVAAGMENSGEVDQAKGIRSTMAQIKDSPNLAAGALTMALAPLMGKDQFEALKGGATLGATTKTADAEAAIAGNKALYSKTEAWAGATKAYNDAVASGDAKGIADAKLKKDTAEADLIRAHSDAAIPLQSQQAAGEAAEPGARALASMGAGESSSATARKTDQDIMHAIEMQPYIQAHQKAQNLLLNTQTDEIRSKLNAVPEKYQEMLEKGSNEAQNSAIQANKMGRVADAFERNVTGPGAAGWPAELAKAWKQAGGTGNAVDDFRHQYNQLKTTSMLSSVASSTTTNRMNETLLEFLSKEFPKDTDNPKLIATTLRRLQAMQNLNTQLKSAQNMWLTNNGYAGIGNARANFTMPGGRVVKQGDSLQQLQLNMIDEAFPKQKPAAADVPAPVLPGVPFTDAHEKELAALAARRPQGGKK